MAKLVKKVRLSAMIPATDMRALDQMAKDNERSNAAEVRIAIHEHLKKDGRIVG